MNATLTVSMPRYFSYCAGAIKVDYGFGQYLRKLEEEDLKQMLLDRSEGLNLRQYGRIIGHRALAVTFPNGRDHNRNIVGDIVIHGMRTLSKATQEGYHLRGLVSIKGKTHRAFTTSYLFELPDGALVNVNVLYCSPMGEL
jgi:hypothetical protein